MSWEQRGSCRYYYRKERSGSRVRSVYVGRGEIAELTAALDAMQREDSRTERSKERIELKAYTPLDTDLDSLARLVSTLTEAVLITADFHKHKRQWRKRRR